MPAFTADRDDEGRMDTYTLRRPSPLLLRELDAYIAYRTRSLNARRSGGAVVSATAEKNKEDLLRFYGFLEHSGVLGARDSIYIKIVTVHPLRGETHSLT